MVSSLSIQQSLLQQLIQQNQLTCGFALNRVSPDNLLWKLNNQAASIGFIYRHIGETINLFGNFLEKPAQVTNTTMGHSDNGQGQDFAASKALLEQGYNMLVELVYEKPDDWWLHEIDTPFFGRVSRLRLFSHVLYHTAHHAGQIALTLSRGE